MIESLIIKFLSLGVFFIMKRKFKGIILIMIICVAIMLLGFVTVSDRLPKFIKDRSSFRINYSTTPFDFTMGINDYSLYINERAINNVRTGSVKLINNMGNNLYNGTSKAMNKTSEVFKNMENRINDIIQNKVR